jgi:hypothetical protein
MADLKPENFFDDVSRLLNKEEKPIETDRENSPVIRLRGDNYGFMKELLSNVIRGRPTKISCAQWNSCLHFLKKDNYQIVYKIVFECLEREALYLETLLKTPLDLRQHFKILARFQKMLDRLLYFTKNTDFPLSDVFFSWKKNESKKNIKKTKKRFRMIEIIHTFISLYICCFNNNEILGRFPENVSTSRKDNLYLIRYFNHFCNIVAMNRIVDEDIRTKFKNFLKKKLSDPSVLDMICNIHNDMILFYKRNEKDERYKYSIYNSLYLAKYANKTLFSATYLKYLKLRVIHYYAISLPLESSILYRYKDYFNGEDFLIARGVLSDIYKSSDISNALNVHSAVKLYPLILRNKFWKITSNTEKISYSPQIEKYMQMIGSYCQKQGGGFYLPCYFMGYGKMKAVLNEKGVNIRGTILQLIGLEYLNYHQTFTLDSFTRECGISKKIAERLLYNYLQVNLIVKSPYKNKEGTSVEEPEYILNNFNYQGPATIDLLDIA